jgi:glycosyltransferase involved in cell wall biosynthesis
MRICVICSGFSHIYGGLEAVIFSLSESWARKGHEVFILSGRGEKTGPKGVRLIKLPYIRSEYFLKIPLVTKIFWAADFEGLSILPFALLYLIGEKPDIVLSNGLAETLPALILNIPSVMISEAPIRSRFNVFKKVDKVIVNDFQSRETLEKNGIKTKLILNGVNASVQETNLEKLRAKYKISSASKIFLTVARLDTNKRIKLLIEAFRLIEQDAALIIVGDGPELAALRKQASSIKSRNRIYFVKPMPQEQLKKLYQLCDVFTLPSKLEGMPLVLIEALSFGKVVVTNPAPEKKFILGKYGVFTNVENANDYSQSLLRATLIKIDVNSPDYRRHMKKFSWTQISQQYIEVFHEVLRKRAILVRK